MYQNAQFLSIVNILHTPHFAFSKKGLNLINFMYLGSKKFIDIWGSGEYEDWSSYVVQPV